MRRARTERDGRTRATALAALLSLAATGALPAVEVHAASGQQAAAPAFRLSEEESPSRESRPRASRSVFSLRRALGVAFLAGSATMAIRGFDYRDEADEFYAAYKRSDDPTEIERLYQRTTNRDVKSQVSWALAAAFGITGARLFFTGDEGRAARTAASLEAAPALAAQLAPAVTPSALGLRLQGRFY